MFHILPLAEINSRNHKSSVHSTRAVLFFFEKRAIQVSVLPFLIMCNYKLHVDTQLEVGFIGGLITPVCSSMLSSSLPVYQAK